MTKEELMKQAKESWWNDDTCSGGMTTEKIYERGFVAGHKSGYQEGLKAKINATTISDCSFKDEWHYPAKGELPKEGVNILLYFKEHFCVTRGYSVGYYENEVFYDDCEMEEDVIAWRYIEPPKEEE